MRVSSRSMQCVTCLSPAAAACSAPDTLFVMLQLHDTQAQHSSGLSVDVKPELLVHVHALRLL